LTYPPYFNTVISGIAAPRGKLLIVSFLYNTYHNRLSTVSGRRRVSDGVEGVGRNGDAEEGDRKSDVRSGRGEESVFFLPCVSDILEASVRILVSATNHYPHIQTSKTPSTSSWT